MKKYLWQSQDWQNFKYDKEAVSGILSKARFIQGKLLGRVSALDIKFQTEAQSEILIEEAVKTSKIEGLELNIESVRSSVAQKLGLVHTGAGVKVDKNIEYLVDLLVDAVNNYNTPLSLQRLNGWHAALFPLGYSGFRKIVAADLRKDKIYVVSGMSGKEKIHFEAPPAENLTAEMTKFIDWFNGSLGKEDGVLRAAAAALKFVTIHPYEDGNGRISRAITDMAMAQDEEKSVRFYSLSAQILKERKEYYRVLEEVQNSKIDITVWYEWFINMFINAIKSSDDIISSAFFKASFWNKIKEIPLNERQIKVIKKLLDAGLGNFSGGLSTGKYAAMTKVSTQTAFRELKDMSDKGIVKQYGHGRSVRYELNSKEK
ncbi:MAG: Fic family protein [Endomicrobium sp.]|jgi:Fic family protein|nr:Fic family protein [Endomicrobium sp.]